MHNRLLRSMRRSFAAFLVIWTLGTGVAFVAQAMQDNKTEQVAQVSAREADFWRLVAGETDGGNIIATSLARDVRNAIEEDRLETFRGHSNTYGGITEAAGFNPFTDEGCRECGPLNAETLAEARLVGEGRLDVVLDSLEVEVVDDGYTLTPGEAPYWMLALYVWVIGGPFLLWWASKTQDIPLSELDLNFDNGKAIPEKSMLVVSAPTLMVPYVLWRRANKRKFAEKIEQSFPEYTAALNDADRILRHRPNPELQAVRDDLAAELERACRSRNDNDLEAIELKVLLNQLKDGKQVLAERSRFLEGTRG